jgi:structural maintenance of chromosome 3 (chondroitin sulfate proteoglycan 6)
VTREVSLGLEAVRRIVIENRIAGVHGPLIELISTKPEFANAVQVAAKGALFHIVVDTDAIAAQVLEQFNSSGAKGRVSFIPLNRINPPERDVPGHERRQAARQRDQCAAHSFVKAVKHVFGKALMCRSLEVAAMAAKQYNLDCITLDGDQVERKGALTGGFSDSAPVVARVDGARQAFRKSVDELLRQAREEPGGAARPRRQGVRGARRDRQARDRRRRRCATASSSCTPTCACWRASATPPAPAAEQRVAALAGVRVAIAALQANSDSLRAERSAPMNSQLSDAESAELHALLEAQTRVQHELATAAAARGDARARRPSSRRCSTRI